MSISSARRALRRTRSAACFSRSSSAGSGCERQTSPRQPQRQRVLGDPQHLGDLGIAEAFEDQDHHLALRQRQLPRGGEERPPLACFQRALLGARHRRGQLVGHFHHRPEPHLLGDERDCPVLRDTRDERLQRGFAAVRRQRLPDGEEDLLDEIFAQARIGLVRHGDARDQRAELRDDPLEGRRLSGGCSTFGCDVHDQLVLPHGPRRRNADRPAGLPRCQAAAARAPAGLLDSGQRGGPGDSGADEADHDSTHPRRSNYTDRARGRLAVNLVSERENSCLAAAHGRSCQS
jgi:hypothetical protein